MFIAGILDSPKLPKEETTMKDDLSGLNEVEKQTNK